MGARGARERLGGLRSGGEVIGDAELRRDVQRLRDIETRPELIQDQRFRSPGLCTAGCPASWKKVTPSFRRGGGLVNAPDARIVRKKGKYPVRAAYRLERGDPACLAAVDADDHPMGHVTARTNYPLLATVPRAPLAATAAAGLCVRGGHAATRTIGVPKHHAVSISALHERLVILPVGLAAGA
jgi:hypothetical protein